mgnify:CR=1 FL=1
MQNLAYQISYTTEAVKHLKKLDPANAKRIRDYLRKRVEQLDEPRQLGAALKGKLSPLWRYRVGDFRVLCELQDDILTVLVVKIGHRKVIYKSNQTH